MKSKIRRRRGWKGIAYNLSIFLFNISKRKYTKPRIKKQPEGTQNALPPC
jgi:hypothetical protein